MKKTLFVVALATMLVFVLTSSAFAVWNRSGQDRLGGAKSYVATGTIWNGTVVPNGGYVSGGESAVVSGTVVQGAGTMIYEDWSTSTGTNNLSNSPHGNYTTTTVKCVVCHAVHYAAPGLAPVGAGQTADTLLRMKASDACVYCHATAGVAVNGRPVYNGLGQVGILPDATSMGHITGPNCNVCHTTVHGMGADESVASLRGYLLKTIPVASAGYAKNAGSTDTSAAPTTNMMSAIVNINAGAVNQNFADGAALGAPNSDFQNTIDPVLRERAVGIFCAECHDGAYATVAAGAATNVSTSGSAMYSGHRIKAPATGDWNGAKAVSSSALHGITIAWADANNCKSCHDTTDNFGNAAFPHAWGTWTGNVATSGSKMWLLSAANAGATKTTMQSVLTTYTAGLQLSDGVCLKCHRASTTEGVGLTF